MITGLLAIVFFIACVAGSLFMINLVVHFLAQGLSRAGGGDKPGCRTFLVVLLIAGVVGILIARFG